MIVLSLLWILTLGLLSIDKVQAETDEIVVVIDPGHDSKRSGATDNGLQEEELNLKIAQYCYNELSEYNGVKVYMTHNTLSCPYPGTNSKDDNIKRIQYAASVNADVVVSIHINSSEYSSVQGVVTYYPNKNYHPEQYNIGKALSQSIQNELIGLGLEDRGSEDKDSQDGTKYPDGSKADYYRVINEGKLQDVTTIIVEHAFISNKSDVQNFLNSEEKLKALGVADATGIAKYYGLGKDDYSPIFDAHYYSETYADLKAAFGDDENALLNHFITFGMNEGRRGNNSFDVYSYRGRYSDLQNAYGTNLKNYYMHYLGWGINEGRDGTPITDAYTVRFMQGETIMSTQEVVFGHSASTAELKKSGAILNLDKQVSCITSDLDVQVSYEYIYDGVNYTSIFDAEYYLAQYPDLRDAYNTDGEKALYHFINWGMNEGRIAKENFDVYSYRGRYVDLQNAYGTKLKSYYIHYLNWGINEGRDGSQITDAYTVRFMQGEEVMFTQTIPFGHSAPTNGLEKSGATLALDKSVSCITSDLDVQVRYQYIYNGVDYAPAFDEGYYLSTYPDLQNAYGTDGAKALYHFINWGMSEGRIACEEFNVHTYKSKYWDLQKAYGNNLNAYFAHYLNWGIDEGRSGK